MRKIVQFGRRRIDFLWQKLKFFEICSNEGGNEEKNFFKPIVFYCTNFPFFEQCFYSNAAFLEGIMIKTNFK